MPANKTNQKPAAGAGKVRPLVVQVIAKQMAQLAAQRQTMTKLDQVAMAEGQSQPNPNSRPNPRLG